MTIMEVRLDSHELSSLNFETSSSLDICRASFFMSLAYFPLLLFMVL